MSFFHAPCFPRGVAEVNEPLKRKSKAALLLSVPREAGRNDGGVLEGRLRRNGRPGGRKAATTNQREERGSQRFEVAGQRKREFN